jgi:hypothetical protein
VREAEPHTCVEVDTMPFLKTLRHSNHGGNLIFVEGKGTLGVSFVQSKVRPRRSRFILE